jgi:rhodanese-related sulfurtransferase
MRSTAATGAASTRRDERNLARRGWLAVESLKGQLESGAHVQLQDVRTAADFNGEWGHIPGARSVPPEELPSRLGEFERDRPVRLVCRTDRRSAQVAAMLAKAGFVDARVMQGGMTAWRARGGPVERRYAHLAADHLSPWADRLATRDADGINPSQGEAERKTAQRPKSLSR